MTGMSGTILYPGWGSDYMEDMRLLQTDDGRWVVAGTVFDDLTGTFNVPEGPVMVPGYANVPLSCVRSLDPDSCELMGGRDER